MLLRRCRVRPQIKSAQTCSSNSGRKFKDTNCETWKRNQFLRAIFHPHETFRFSFKLVPRIIIFIHPSKGFKFTPNLIKVTYSKNFGLRNLRGNTRTQVLRQHYPVWNFVGFPGSHRECVISQVWRNNTLFHENIFLSVTTSHLF